ncbi:MAG: STAS domain-containing protein [Gammaproteobacteria bacterium]
MSEITADGGNIRVRGDLTAATARALFEDKWLEREPRSAAAPAEIRIDLSEVGEADSAGLALLLHWANRIEAASGKAVFAGAPKQLRRMAKISGLEGLFG